MKHSTMNNLLVEDLLQHFRITSKVDIDAYLIKDCNLQYFELEDVDQKEAVLKKRGEGKVVFFNNKGLLDVLCYEAFISACKRPRSFQEGRKRCDYLLYHQESNEGVFLLNEITSAKGKIENLMKSLEHYEGGKLEKAERQLAESLKTLMEVPSVETFINKYPKRICLVSYRVFSSQLADINEFVKPFNRFAQIEQTATKGNGAVLKSAEINQMGFEYRRICYPEVFTL